MLNYAYAILESQVRSEIVALSHDLMIGYAQCAGCGADYNKADRHATVRLVERQRPEKIDPPIQKDPRGNTIIGGSVTGIGRGSVGAAARAIVMGTPAGAAMQKAWEASRK
jgi:hypothetical protein